jgi:hypothetical protein
MIRIGSRTEELSNSIQESRSFSVVEKRTKGHATTCFFLGIGRNQDGASMS